MNKATKSRQANKLTTNDFELLYRENYTAVRRVVRSFRFDEGESDDIIQDSFLLAWQRFSQLQNIEQFSYWLLSIARNACLQNIRKNRAKKLVALDDKIIAPVSTNNIWYQSEESLEIRLICETEQDQKTQACRNILNSEPTSPQGKVAKMFYLDQFTVKDISHRLKLNQNTVLSHLRRFRKKMVSAIPLQNDFAMRA